MSDYFAKPGLSFHQLKDFAKAPRYYYDKHVLRIIKDQDKAAYAFGRAVHCCALEGMPAFVERFIVAPPEHLTETGLLSTKKATKDWLASLDGKEVISANDAERVLRLRERVHSNVHAIELLSGGEPEVEVFGSFQGVATKGRCDWLDRTRGLVVDLKTTRNLDTFRADAFEYGYDQQLAWYMELTGAKGHALLVVESEAPYRVAVMHFDSHTIYEAHCRNGRLVAQYAECQANDDWPVDPTEIITLTRPAA